MLIDTHIHLDRLGNAELVTVEMATARAAGIGLFIVPGVDRGGWSSVREVVRRHDGSLAAFGLHPCAAAEWNDSCRAELTNYLRDEKAVALGEIGLDRLIDVPLPLQEKAFREQLQMACACSLPVLLHCRKMPGRLLEILKAEQADRVGGIMHAFSGSYQTAKMAIDLGFVLSFGGGLTYPEARRSIDVVRQLPDDAIVIETDAPDLTPHPYRGEPNRPVWLELVLLRLAEIRGWSRERAAEITTANARRVLNLD